MIPWLFSQGGSKISNKFFVPLNHTSRFRQGHKNHLHENCPCGQLLCYRKTSVSLLTVDGLGNKHWRPSPTVRSAAVRLVLFLLGPPLVIIYAQPSYFTSGLFTFLGMFVPNRPMPFIRAVG
jgi:hypothetical protein